MKKIIFTDLDGTLTLKDTYTQFLLQHLTLHTVVGKGFALLKMYIQYLLGGIDGDSVKVFTFSMFFQGYDKDTNIDSFMQNILWNRAVLEKIEGKRREGYRVVIVTASPDIYVKHVCEHLGFDGFIATQTVDDGKYLSGSFAGKVCNFEQKPKRIQEFLAGQTPEHTLSYGNSSGDYAMLGFCDESYFVKKSDIKRFEKE